MKSRILLPYSDKHVPFEYDTAKFDVIGQPTQKAPLSDLEIGNLFDSPIGSPPVEELIAADQNVLIVVPDATRQSGSGQIINLLVRRLIASGTMPYDISIIFATGLHRKVTTAERDSILTPFISQRTTAYDHDPGNLVDLVRVGETTTGITVELNRKLVEADHVILIGSVGFHYFAGFTGGRKLICPGLASKKTIRSTHSLAFDVSSRNRAADVSPGKLKNNPVHEAFVSAAEFIKPSFLFNNFVNSDGDITDLICGDWKESHHTACEKYKTENSFGIDEKRDLVVVSAGGSPHDINMVQAHKALEMASYACRDGGTIVLLAHCIDGMGGGDFEKAFEYGDRLGIGESLAARYTVGGQTAWSLRRNTDRFNVLLVSDIDEDLSHKMGFNYCENLSEAAHQIERFETGYILPYGSKFLPFLTKKDG